MPRLNDDQWCQMIADLKELQMREILNLEAGNVKVVVATRDGNATHDADKWEIDEGRLHLIGRGGIAVATYNQGAWESVTALSQ